MLFKEKVQKPESLFWRLKSAIIVLLVGLILVSIIYTCYSIFQSVLKNLDSRFQAHNIYVTRNTARIQIPQLSHHELVDSSRRHVYKALSNLQAPPEESRGRLIRMMKLKEWKDRRRIVYKGSGTEAANMGWFDVTHKQAVQDPETNKTKTGIWLSSFFMGGNFKLQSVKKKARRFVPDLESRVYLVLYHTNKPCIY